MKKQSLYFASLLLFLSSCNFEEEITPDVDVERNNVLAYVFLTPDLENHWGFVRHAPSFREEPPRNAKDSIDYAIRNASIRVWEAGQENEKFDFVTSENYYTLSSSMPAFDVQEDKTYHVSIQANNRMLTGSVQVPKKVTDVRVDDIRAGRTDIFPDEEEQDEDTWVFDISWQDIPDEENYYILAIYGGHRKEVATGYVVDLEPISLEVEYEDISRDDQGQDGQRLTVSVSTEGICPPPPLPARCPFDIQSWNFVDLFLITCDKVYARYHFITQSGDDEGNLFVQPLTLELNLEGGLGGFSSYRVHRQRIDISRYVADLAKE